jgi:L-ascorbate metabolism protein UlaG (beta-lactamase superfamily)
MTHQVKTLPSYLSKRLMVLVLSWVTVLGLSACTTPYQGTVSDHFDGKVFFNPSVKKESSVLGYLWLRLTSSQATWPDTVALPASSPPPESIPASEGTARVTLLGHATMLIQIGGLNILTDPVWSERASFVQWIGPKRVTPPSLSLEALPPIDLILISHDHYDHLDLPTLAKLHQKHKPRVIVPLGNRALVQASMPSSQVSEHDWSDSIQVTSARGKVSIHVEPMLHGSGRSPFDQMQTLWAAFVIEANGLKIYHAGDTGYGNGEIFRAAGVKHGGFDLALLPIGAFEPAAFMMDSHMRPSDAVKAMNDLKAKRAMAHHFETFQLGFEAFDAPRQEIQTSMQQLQLPLERFFVPRPGEFLVLQR